jgi:uncharacterized protein
MDLTLSLTHACNLRCTYCYTGEKRAVAMSRETAARALDMAFAVRESRVQLGFFGGEPLLEWDLLTWCTEQAEALAAERSIQLMPTLTTNGILLDPDRLRWLRNHRFHLGLSIDGNRAMHDITRRHADGTSSFEACLRGLERSLEVFPDVEVITVLDPANISHCAEGVRFLVREKGVRSISLNPNFHASWPEEALVQWQSAFATLGDLYLAAYRSDRPIYLNFMDTKIVTGLKGGYEHHDRCSYGEREIAVAPSGRIYPCERMIGADVDTQYSLGDVFNGFNPQWCECVLVQRGNRNPECKTCAYRSRCMNWCCCINHARTGAIDRTDGLVCFHEQLSIQVADDVGNQLFQERNPAFLERFYRETRPHSDAIKGIP